MKRDQPVEPTISEPMRCQRVKPHFSIIIPTLNEEKYLPRLLESLSRQLFRDFEVVIVDGGSSDKTIEIAMMYADKVVVERCNQSKARNIGASISNGEYLVFLDADAVVDPLFLKKARDIFAKYEHANVKCIVGRPEPIALTKIGRTAFAFGWLLCRVKATFPGYMGILVERSIFKRAGGFNPDLAYGEDLDFLIRVSSSTKIAYPKDLVVYSDTRRWMKNGKINIIEVSRIVRMVIEYLTTRKSHTSYPVIR